MSGGYKRISKVFGHASVYYIEGFSIYGCRNASGVRQGWALERGVRKF
jgi:hypothetical protein